MVVLADPSMAMLSIESAAGLKLPHMESLTKLAGDPVEVGINSEGYARRQDLRSWSFDLRGDSFILIHLQLGGISQSSILGFLIYTRKENIFHIFINQLGKNLAHLPGVC